jgi:aspartate racemase
MGAGAFYYRSLVKKHLDRGITPDLVMVHANVREVLSLASAGEARRLAEYMAGLLRVLAAAGAEIAAIPAFAPQICAGELAEISPLPLVSILDAMVDEVERRGLRRVAIFGTRVTVETELYGRLVGCVEVVSPSEGEVNLVANMYASIVSDEQATPEEFDTLRSLAHRLIEREGLDAILLAGTDLAFVFNPDDTDFPHVDGARVHIEALMNRIAPQA